MGLVEIALLVAGGTTSVVVSGAYALAYAVTRTSRLADIDRCPALSVYASKKPTNIRCCYLKDHDGPHGALTREGRKGTEIWWTEVDSKL